MTDLTAIAQTYFDAWFAQDFETLSGLLAQDVTFDGPLASIQGRDACVDGLKGMSTIITGFDLAKIFVDGDDVLTWYTMHTDVAPPAATANWSHVENGLITAIRATFDARPFTPPGS